MVRNYQSPPPTIDVGRLLLPRTRAARPMVFNGNQCFGGVTERDTRRVIHHDGFHLHDFGTTHVAVSDRRHFFKRANALTPVYGPQNFDTFVRHARLRTVPSVRSHKGARRLQGSRKAVLDGDLHLQLQNYLKSERLIP